MWHYSEVDGGMREEHVGKCETEKVGIRSTAFSALERLSCHILEVFT